MMIDTARPLLLVRWLLLVAFLVFTIVIVGGVTRLTESGLSITEWKPIAGLVPPLNAADWAAEFDKYRKIPEYQLINKGMSLADFKFIYFWEWIHRQLGRLIGLAFALPFAWFMLKRAVPKGYAPRLAAIMALIGLQGAFGWWMVSSGLEARTDVSHYRLAVHLLTALFILAGLIWTALDLAALHKSPAAVPARMTRLGLIVGGVLFIQLLFGAYTAGLNAGHVSNTWPLMNDHLVPEGIDWSQGGLSAVFNDPYLIHFIHRWWAWIAVGALILLARQVKLAGVRPASIAIHGAFGTMVLLGIATVMTNVHIGVAVIHQAVGAILVASTAWGIHVIGRQKALA
jgi:heme a synthase